MTLKPGDLVAAVRKDIRQARGAIRARRSELDEMIAHAEAAVEQGRRDVAATSGPETAAAVGGWRELAGEAALGAASAAWSDWPAEPEPAEAGPCLYRVGTVAGDVPALIPLLDTGHLKITGGQTPLAD